MQIIEKLKSQSEISEIEYRYRHVPKKVGLIYSFEYVSQKL